jgi:hypothetical protein
MDILRVFAAQVIKRCVRIFASLLEEGDKREVPNSRGGFFVVEKQNLICDVAIELDWQSSVRQDDAVERKLNMDLLTVLAGAKQGGMVKNINLEPVIKKIVVSSGFDDPDEIFTAPEMEPTDPAIEHMAMLSGDAVLPIPEEDLENNYNSHMEFWAMITKDPAYKKLWGSQPGAVQRLIDHIEQTAELMRASGLGQSGGVLPGKGSAGGSGAQFNRPSQGVPNEGDMQAGISRATNVGGGGTGRLAGF